MSKPSASAVTFTFGTANGTAIAGSDYVAKAASKSIAAGSTTATIVITIKGDLVKEANETFKVNLATPVGATFSDALGIGTIVNDD